jgi:uridine kinase
MSAKQGNDSGKPLIIGVAGGTGSGKTTVAQHIVNNIGENRAALIQYDSYYKDQSERPPEERARINYDHPDALDNDLLYYHLQELSAGRPIDMPCYDFKIDNRTSQTIRVLPYPVIVVEGILAFYDERIRSMMGLKIFVDTDADLRFIRRLRRDVAERGRSVDSVIDRYLSTVRLMHLEFIEPTKRFADLIIPEGGFNMPMLLDRLVRLLREFDRGKQEELVREAQNHIAL